MKRLICFLLSVIMLTALVACNESDTPPSQPTVSEIGIDDYRIEYLGRTESDGERVLINNTASGFAVTFYGKSLSAKMSADFGEPIFAVLTDGERDPEKHKVNIATDAKDGSVLLAEFDTAGRHTVQVQKITEEQISRASLSGITVTDGDLEEYDAPQYAFKMEVYGDSITAGFGNMRPEGAKDDQKLQNGLMTYSAQAAAALNAEYRVFAESGMGLYTNPYGDPDHMEDIFKNVSPESKTRWDMESYIPDVVIIYIGTNDHWAAEGSEGNEPFDAAEYEKHYYNFARSLYYIYGRDTVFVLCSGMLDTTLSAPVGNVAARLKSDGITATSVVLPNATGGHPTLSVHTAAGKVLSDAIDDILS